MAIYSPEELVAGGYLVSREGAVDLSVSILLFALSNALAYGLAKAFNLDWGRLLAGLIIIITAFLLYASARKSFRYAFLLGMGEIVIGSLDFLASKVGTPLSYILDPMYGVT